MALEINSVIIISGLPLKLLEKSTFNTENRLFFVLNNGPRAWVLVKIYFCYHYVKLFCVSSLKTLKISSYFHAFIVSAPRISMYFRKKWTG